MYQGNSAQIRPSVTPSAATVRSLRRSRLAAGGWAVKGTGARSRRKNPARRERGFALTPCLAASLFLRSISSIGLSAGLSGILLVPGFQVAGEVGKGVGGGSVPRRLRHSLVDQRDLPDGGVEF